MVDLMLVMVALISEGVTGGKLPGEVVYVII